MTTPEELGKRLRAAIHHWAVDHGRDGRGEGVAMFATALAAADVPGSSRAMLHRYLSGRKFPDVDFLLGAAKEAGVRAEWLLTGEGDMLADSARVRDSGWEDLEAGVAASLRESLGAAAAYVTPMTRQAVTNAAAEMAVEVMGIAEDPTTLRWADGTRAFRSSLEMAAWYTVQQIVAVGQTSYGAEILRHAEPAGLNAFLTLTAHALVFLYRQTDRANEAVHAELRAAGLLPHEPRDGAGPSPHDDGGE